jgi:hypothetical protein
MHYFRQLKEEALVASTLQVPENHVSLLSVGSYKYTLGVTTNTIMFLPKFVKIGYGSK